LSKPQKFSPHPLKKAPKHKKLKFCQKLKTPHPPPPPFSPPNPLKQLSPKKKTSVFLKSTKLLPTTQNWTKKLHLKSPLQQTNSYSYHTHTHTHTHLSLSRFLALSKHWDPFDIIIIIIITAAGRVWAFKGVRRSRDFEDSWKSTKWYLKGPPPAPSPHKTQQRWRTGATAMNHYIRKIENTDFTWFPPTDFKSW
jgi:hypothetical protein